VIRSIGKNSLESIKLTARQRRAIPLVLAAKSIEEGCRLARITPVTWYAWLKNEGFSSAIDTLRCCLCFHLICVIVRLRAGHRDLLKPSFPLFSPIRPRASASSRVVSVALIEKADMRFASLWTTPSKLPLRRPQS